MQYKTKIPPGPRNKHRMYGGPYNQSKIPKSFGIGSMVIRVGHHHGYYNDKDVWVNLNPELKRRYFEIAPRFLNENPKHYSVLCKDPQHGKRIGRVFYRWMGLNFSVREIEKNSDFKGYGYANIDEYLNERACDEM